MSKPIRLLILEDNPADMELMLRELQKQGLAYEAKRVQTEEEFSKGIEDFAPDAILADYGLPHYDGFSAMKLAQQKCPETPFIFVSGTLGEESAIEALKSGATDYVLKHRLARLGPAVRRALDEAEERQRRCHAEEQLRRSRDQLRALAAHLQSVREEERTHIAREIHDDLAQNLTALKIDLAVLSQEQAPGGAVPAKLADLSKLADSAIETVHRIATELRPVALDKMGLYPACQRLARDFSQRTSAQCELTLPEEKVPLNNACATALFRILQESLTNVARHAQATRVTVSLQHEQDQMVLTLQDNGRGIELSEIEDSKSIGLLGMSERAHLLGGDFTITGLAGRGTTVRAQVPIEPEGQSHQVGIAPALDHYGQIREALRRHKDYLRLIMDIVPALIAYVDTDFRFVLANQTYEKWFGERPETIRGRHVREVLGEAAWKNVQPYMERALKGEQVTFEHEFPFPKGGSKWHHVSYTPDQDAQGEVRGFVVLVRDITEEKQAEAELRMEITQRKRMEEALVHLNRTLESRIAERTARLEQINHDLEKEISERQATQAELRQAHNRLQALSRKLLNVQEEERQHLACELHDEIGQALTALKINLQSMQRFPEPALAEKRLQDAVEILNQILEQVRGLSLSLRPPLMEELGLVPALRNYLQQQTQRAGLTMEFKVSGPIPRLDPAVETACFRVAQEAVTNVVRHAKASSMILSLTQEQHFLTLLVRDNGIGCEPELALQQSELGGSLGWIGMQERAALVKGKIVFRSSPNQGTEIRAEFPISGPEAEMISI